jgi:EAL domain-containing protein (putative c-di-GMP-specific phosphodiesterase class I)
MPRATIGYALTDDVTQDAADLLRNADLAMYAGKHEHKGTTTAFAPEMHRHLIEQLELEDELREALERDQISVHYQPLVNLTDGRIVSTEALARWNHPRLGLVPPNTFIPMAERTGLIHPIGEWVLNEACRQTAQWHVDHPNDEPLCVSVNVSALQLLDPSLVDRVQNAIENSGLAAHYLTLEITESVVAEGNSAVIAQLDQLDHIGVKLAVDDFGTGYSSLSTLHQFPISILKIDKCFVDHVPDQQERLTLLTSIVDLGRSLGLQTVAEGVEEAEQVAALQELGCGQAQGYHFARPLTSETIERLLDGSHLPLQSSPTRPS